MSERWRFEQDDEQKWTWRHSKSDEHVESDDAFTHCIDCMLDAVRYVVRRRRETPDETTGN